MPRFDFSPLFTLLIPEIGIWIWFPVVAFVLYAIKAWKQDRALHRMTFHYRELRCLATPLIVMLEMLIISGLLMANRNLKSLDAGFGYLFLSLFPLSAYLVWRYRQCWQFTVRYCLAVIWLMIGIGFAYVAATIGG